jgi:hypothetical protein
MAKKKGFAARLLHKSSTQRSVDEPINVALKIALINYRNFIQQVGTWGDSTGQVNRAPSSVI